jgi:hypothetical protein
MGTLIVGSIDFNNPIAINELLKAVRNLKNNRLLYFQLDFKPNFYFKIINGPIPSDGGWYIILNDGKPIYVGQANNFDSRLNSNNGSLDNFAHGRRTFDSERNFIKKFIEIRVLINMMVIIIPDQILCAEMCINPGNLLKIDRDNIEKLLNIFRGILFP